MHREHFPEKGVIYLSVRENKNKKFKKFEMWFLKHDPFRYEQEFIFQGMKRRGTNNELLYSRFALRS